MKEYRLLFFESTKIRGGNTTTLSFKTVGTAGDDYLATDFADTKSYVTSTTVMTYATHYVTTHVITLPPTDAPLDAVLEIVNPVNPAQTQKVNLHSNNVDKLGKQLMQVGQILDASTAAAGQGRWQKAVVTTVAVTATLPTKYDHSWGAAQYVFALIGSTTSGYSAYTVANQATISARLNYLKTNNGGSSMVFRSSDTGPVNVGNGYVLVPSALMPNVISASGLGPFSNSGTANAYKVIVVNGKMDDSNGAGGTWPLPYLATNGTCNRTTDKASADNNFSSSKVAALLNY